MRCPELAGELDRLLACLEGDPAAGSQMVAALKRCITRCGYEDAASILRRALHPGLDFTTAQAFYRVYRQITPHLDPDGTPLEVAVLASSTVEQWVQLLELYLFGLGVSASVYRPEFGVVRQEILDPRSGLYEFRPKVVFIGTTWRDLSHVPRIGDDAQIVARCIEEEYAEWSRLWDVVYERLGCQIVQNNFDIPPWRLLGNLEGRHPSGFARFVTLVNQALMDRAPGHVTIHDLEQLAASVGRWTWGDQRFFHHAKLPCAPECLVDYAHSAASVIGAQLGLARKCLVLDLDNTLWGGVIGDDGLGGIRLGQGEPEAEAFQAFQRYVKGLRHRGVILAVCSKNEEATAREAFDKHPGMVLSLDDISCFVANWENKVSNLQEIARRLNIGLNSLVFVDDNPAERSIVRRLLPEVAVPELPEDPAGYIRAIERHRYFQAVSLGREDLQRTELYRANAARERAEANVANVEDFLKSLQMVARVEPVGSLNLERTAQLISRSNQFNLTTRRYSAAEVSALASDPRWLTRTVSLSDRFGDNGLISVLLARIEEDVLRIDTWLMSCRVLKRGVEDFLLNHLWRIARQHGLRAIRGEYVPTAKNALVKDHYARLGFELAATSEDGHTWWELPVTGEEEPRTAYIEEEQADGAASR